MAMPELRDIELPDTPPLPLVQQPLTISTVSSNTACGRSGRPAAFASRIGLGQHTSSRKAIHRGREAETWHQGGDTGEGNGNSEGGRGTGRCHRRNGPPAGRIEVRSSKLPTTGSSAGLGEGQACQGRHISSGRGSNSGESIEPAGEGARAAETGRRLPRSSAEGGSLADAQHCRRVGSLHENPLGKAGDWLLCCDGRNATGCDLSNDCGASDCKCSRSTSTTSYGCTLGAISRTRRRVRCGWRPSRQQLVSRRRRRCDGQVGRRRRVRRRGFACHCSTSETSPSKLMASDPMRHQIILRYLKSRKEPEVRGSGQPKKTILTERHKSRK